MKAKTPSTDTLGAGENKAAKEIVDDALALPKKAPYSTTYALIREHHRRSGAVSWNREKFTKLCVAFDETKDEMGMRIGLHPWELRRRLKDGRFTLPEGILLEFHWRFIQHFRTGLSPDGSAFAPCSTPKSPSPKV